MIDDPDIFRAAKLLPDQHGEDAPQCERHSAQMSCWQKEIMKEALSGAESWPRSMSYSAAGWMGNR